MKITWVSFRTVAIVAACVFGGVGCSKSEPSAPPTTPTPVLATPTVVPKGSGGFKDMSGSGGPSAPIGDASPPPPPPTMPQASVPLPREAGGVKLGMSRKDIIAKLGALDCHENADGVEVCIPQTPPKAGPSGLHVYIHADTALSFAYDEPTPDDPLQYLDSLIRKFGAPTLTGVADKDKAGRLHELYGWKTEDTLFSARFIWEEAEANPRRLLGTNIAVWDRKAYDKWERDPERIKKMQKNAPPTPVPPAPGAVSAM